MKRLAILALLLFQGTPPLQSELGAITGRVLGVKGKPAGGVRIAAMAVQDGSIVHASSLLSLVETDTGGQYRLDKIPPGRYYIIAGLIDSPTYYPGTSNQVGAKTVEVLGGKTVGNIDFRMVMSSGFKVSGRFAVKPSLPNPEPILLISPPATTLEAVLQPDGTFEFRKVLPGTYNLVVPFGLIGGVVNVTDHDILNLEIGNGPGVRVTGKLVNSEIQKDGFGYPIRSVMLWRRPPNSIDASPTTAPNSRNSDSRAPQQLVLATKVNRDGTFEFLKVPSGTYTIRVGVPGPVPPIPLTVGDKDITGLELPGF